MQPGFPDVQTLLGLSAAAWHIPLVSQREGDGACTTRGAPPILGCKSYAQCIRHSTRIRGYWRIGRSRAPLGPFHAEEDAFADAVRAVDDRVELQSDTQRSRASKLL